MNTELPSDQSETVAVEPSNVTASTSHRSRSRLGFVVFFDWAAAILVTAVILFAHAAFFRNAGGLWRDEANTVNTATSPTLNEMRERLEFESYPQLWPLCVRAWHAAGFGNKVADLRVLGLIIGIALLAVFWLQALLIQRQPPLFALIAAAAFPAVIVYGDSMRAYGLGLLLMILAMTAIWKCLVHCTPRSWGLAVLAATASVYCLYQNCVFVFVFCMAAALAAFIKREWKTALALPLVGLAAALLLLLGQGSRLFHKPDWLDLVVRQTVTVRTLAEKFREALRYGGDPFPMHWGIAFGVAVLAGLACMSRRLSRTSSNDRPLAVFFGMGMLLAPACYLLFLLNLGFTTEPWYYLGIIVFLGISIDHLVACFVRLRPFWRWLRLGALALMFYSMWQPIWLLVPQRMTTVDLIAEEINGSVQSRDFVIANPWWLGVSFGRCYTGAAEWTTVPELQDRICHRYDLVRKRLAEESPLASIFDKIDQALKSGGTVYLVGDIVGWDLQQGVPRLPPAPQLPTGWHEEPYLTAWGKQVLAYLFVQSKEPPIPWTSTATGLVNPYENMRMLQFSGWEGRDRGAVLRTPESFQSTQGIKP